MAGITLAQAEAKLATWLAAEERIAGGQSYWVGQRSLTRANLAEVREQINYWETKVRRLSRGGLRMHGFVPQ